MSHGFRAVQWNRFKVAYDIALVALIALFMCAYLWLAPAVSPGVAQISPEILRIRALGAAAYFLLTLILAIGPAARLDVRLLPVLYNRRHAGVLLALVAAAHFYAVLDWYHGHGVTDPFASVLGSNPNYADFADFPFEALGVIAFAVLLVMAAISHDFWLAYLSPPVWKAIHMAVYPAWGLVVAHVALGAMQHDRGLVLPAILGLSLVCLTVLHLLAARREAGRKPAPAVAGRWVAVAAPHEIADKRAHKVVLAEGERVAVFRDGETFHALSDVCAHQNGPLSEGRIVDGCVTCPWHGFQYRAKDGCAPPPFTEKLPTYRLRLRDGVIELDTESLPPGTPVAPLLVAVE